MIYEANDVHCKFSLYFNHIYKCPLFSFFFILLTSPYFDHDAFKDAQVHQITCIIDIILHAILFLAVEAVL